MLSASDAKKLSENVTLSELDQIIRTAVNMGMDYAYIEPSPYTHFLLSNPKAKDVLPELTRLGYKVYDMPGGGIKISWK